MSLLGFLEKINTLKRTPRMGWLESGMRPPDSEDVAQHTFETVIITLLLTDAVDKKINSERALRMAIVHDWAEAITGDFSRDVTKEIGSEVKEEVEELAMENILVEDISSGEDYLEGWREYSEERTIEAKLVHVADRLSVLVEANYLFKRGKRSEKLKEIWNTVREELDSYIEVFPILEALLTDLDENYPF